MKPNATLTIKFPNKTINFPVEWIGEQFVNGEDVAEKIFFNSSQEMGKNFVDGNPQLSVTLDSDPRIKCQSFFESETGSIYPTKNLEKLKKKK